MYYKILKDKITSRKATVAIIGLGYVGLPLLIQFYRKGFNCIGIDIDKKKIDDIYKKKFEKNYFESIIKKKRKHSVKKLKQIKFSSNYTLISKADIIIMCLPTPIYKNKKPNLSLITNSLNKMSNFLKKGQLLSLESTVAPGTTNKVLGKFLQDKKKFKISEDFFLIYSPERENPVIKNIGQKFNFYNTPKICSGYSLKCTNLGAYMYSKILKTVVKTNSTKNAEMSKMIENVYRSVNIAFVNELKMLCHKMKIDIHEVLKLAGTKPFGFTKFKPGPGIGGHCIPIDPYYLLHEAKNYNFYSKFIDIALKTNEEVTKWCLKKTQKIFLKENIGKKGSKVLMLGITYKANIDDVRESPALKFFEYFKKRKINFDYCDPYILNIKHKNIHKKSIKLNYKLFKSYNAILLLTGHNIFNKNKIINNSNLIIDTRGFFKKYKKKKIYFI